MATSSTTNKSFDVLTATATELQGLLEEGSLTSVDVVEAYLAQIKKHNQSGLGLRAIASLPPKELLLAEAKKLDEERSTSGARGPLHGIPIIVKDSIMTAPALGMPTEVGAVAFEGVMAKKNATIVSQLLGAGMIIIGKASLTEFCGHKSTGMSAGWSASNGQTQSPYIKGGKRAEDWFAGHTGPGGSSSGSGAGVAAGFSPVSIGTDTIGSLVLPANRAGLYGLKITPGDVSREGIFNLSPILDSSGPMSKSTIDLANLVEVILTPEARTLLPKGGLIPALSPGWSELRVGYVDYDKWPVLQFTENPTVNNKQIKGDYVNAVNKLRELGVQVQPLDLEYSGPITHNGKTSTNITMFHFRAQFQKFIDNLQNPPVYSLSELIIFNSDHAASTMPEPHTNQDCLITSINADMTPKEAEEAMEAIRRTAEATLKNTFEQVDIILAPGDCMLASPISSARYTIGVLPMGTHVESCGQPQGLTIAAKAHDELKLLRFMNAFEASFPKRNPPPLLVE